MGDLFVWVMLYSLGLALALPYAVHWVYADHVRTNGHHSVVALIVCCVGAIVWPLILAIILLFFFVMTVGFILWMVVRPVVDNRPWRRKNV